MRLVNQTPSPKPRAENKATRSCPPYSLGQQAALADRLAVSELLLAFLDDVYVIARPDCVARFSTCSRTRCGDTRTSVPTLAEPRSGTQQEPPGVSVFPESMAKGSSAGFT